MFFFSHVICPSGLCIELLRCVDGKQGLIIDPHHRCAPLRESKSLSSRQCLILQFREFYHFQLILLKTEEMTQLLYALMRVSYPLDLGAFFGEV